MVEDHSLITKLCLPLWQIAAGEAFHSPRETSSESCRELNLLPSYVGINPEQFSMFWDLSQNIWSSSQTYPKRGVAQFSHWESWETSLESCGELDLFCICCRERLSFLLVCGNIKNTKVVDKQLRICFPHSERESWIWATKGSVVSNLKTNIIQSINCCTS